MVNIWPWGRWMEGVINDIRGRGKSYRTSHSFTATKNTKEILWVMVNQQFQTSLKPLARSKPNFM